MNSLNKQKIKLFYQSDQFNSLTVLAEELITEWATQMMTGQTEFEYLKNCFERDGRIQGLNSLLKKIASIGEET